MLYLLEIDCFLDLQLKGLVQKWPTVSDSGEFWDMLVLYMYDCFCGSKGHRGKVCGCYDFLKQYVRIESGREKVTPKKQQLQTLQRSVKNSKQPKSHFIFVLDPSIFPVV